MRRLSTFMIMLLATPAASAQSPAASTAPACLDARQVSELHQASPRQLAALDRSGQRFRIDLGADCPGSPGAHAQLLVRGGRACGSAGEAVRIGAATCPITGVTPVEARDYAALARAASAMAEQTAATTLPAQAQEAATPKAWAAFAKKYRAEMGTPEAQLKMIKEMEAAHEPITADLGEGVQRRIYYDDSTTLKQLRVFPYVQIGIFLAFLAISYFAFSSARRAEQNLVWVGMAKETAHQLGTPISSLEGWVEYLRELDEMKGQEHILKELEHDIGRLGLVADRFSKIGSIPQLTPEDVNETLERNISYMQRRASSKAKMTYTPAHELTININRQLFDWVLENLLKNALDAMGGEGSIHIAVSTEGTKVAIDVTDTGSGVPKGKFETIFEPGYSTKRRGWGLGLSLTKRIVEEYHKGKIFVKHSEVGKGTTFRILLPMG